LAERRKAQAWARRESQGSRALSTTMPGDCRVGWGLWRYTSGRRAVALKATPGDSGFQQKTTDVGGRSATRNPRCYAGGKGLLPKSVERHLVEARGIIRASSEPGALRARWGSHPHRHPQKRKRTTVRWPSFVFGGRRESHSFWRVMNSLFFFNSKKACCPQICPRVRTSPPRSPMRNRSRSRMRSTSGPSESAVRAPGARCA
jgi:hypothetical protein